MAHFFQFAWDALPSLLQGSVTTLILTAICLTSGFILGILLALGRVYGNKLIYIVITGYINIIRGTPLLIQLLIIYYSLPHIGIILPALPAAALAFALNTCAYQAEYIRGGIQSVQATQVLAAHALGMSSYQTSLYIVLPQALRMAILPLSNEGILMLKTTSLSFLVGVPELLATARKIAYQTFRYLDAFIICAVIYIVIVFIFVGFLGFIHKRLRIPGLQKGTITR